MRTESDRRLLRLAPLLVLLGAACETSPGTRARMDLDADTTQPTRFFDFPYPSDLRLDEEGHPRVTGHDPLPGLSPRSIYEPVGEGDEYFSTGVYDAMALAYDNVEGGEAVWPSMQGALALDGRAGLAPYPIADNRRSSTDEAFTGVVAQYRSDGIANAHYIFRQLDAVKFQYRCFLATAVRGSIPRVLAPAPIDSPCL
jgi:hypothetical protein